MTLPVNALTTQLNAYYLGTAGAMQRLRVPDDAVQGPLNRGEVAHTLLGGGTAMTRRAKTRRNYQVSFSGCTPDTAQILVGFYAGDFGDGPFMFVDPAWRNALSDQVSTFGARLQAVGGWTLSSPGAQSLTYSTSIAPFETPSGTAVWAGAGNGSRLGMGTWNGSLFTPDTATAPPYLSDRTNPASVYIRTASSTASMSVRGLAVAADGTVASTTTTTLTANSSGWQRYTAVVPASLTAAYVILDILCNTASAPNILLSCADVQYGVTVPQGWVGGLGIPRVVIAAMGSQNALFVLRDHTLQLSEI